MIKIHLSSQDILAQKLTFILFLIENMLWVLITEALTTHNMFPLKNKKNIYLIIWIHSLARVMQSLPQNK